MGCRKTVYWVAACSIAIVAAWPDIAAEWSPGLAGRACAQAATPAVFTNGGEADGRSTPAATTPKKRPGSKEVPRKKVHHGFTPEREAAALTFVKQYHPELARLLTVLETKEKEEYCRAVRDLFRTSERLAVYREKFPDRYELELLAWQIKSRIQLLATRLRLDPEDGRLVQDLKQALIEQVDVRLEMLRQDREQQTERLKRLDEQIDKLHKQRESDADKQLETLVRAALKKTSPKQKPKEAGKDVTKRGPRTTEPTGVQDSTPK